MWFVICEMCKKVVFLDGIPRRKVNLRMVATNTWMEQGTGGIATFSSSSFRLFGHQGCFEVGVGGGEGFENP